MTRTVRAAGLVFALAFAVVFLRPALQAAPVPALTDVRVNADPPGSQEAETSLAVNPLDPSNLAAVWMHFSGKTSLGFGFSSDGGATWQDRLIDFPNSFGLADPTLVADGHGTFFLAFTIVLSSSGSDVDNYVLRSTDGGATFSAPVSAGKFLDKPALGVDPAGGTVYMTGITRDA